MLVNISNNLLKDGETEHIYHGVTRNGQTDTTTNPILEGNLIAGAFYQADIDHLSGNATPYDSEEYPGFKYVRAPYFGQLYIYYLPENEYIAFADEDVIPALYAAGISDNVGITVSQAAQVSSVGSAFTGKTNISSLNELRHFTKITQLVAGTSSSGGAFRGCTALTSVTIPEKVTSIGAYAFSGCTSLATLTFTRTDSGTVTIGDNAFANAIISRINIPSIASWMRLSWNANNVIDTNHGLWIDGTRVTSFSVPSGWPSVGQYSFYRCTGITDVTIPSSCTSIGQYAFARSSVTSVSIPSTVTTIGNYAFYYCSNLSNLTIPSSVTSIHVSAICVPGNGGIVKVGGNVTGGGWAGTSGQSFTGSHLVVCGSWTSTDGALAILSGTHPTSLRIGGDLQITTNANAPGIVDAGSSGSINNSSNFEFLEIMGRFYGIYMFGTNSSRYIKFGTIIHLGYNGMACTAAQARVSNMNIKKVYIGTGESEAADQAIIDQYYLTDAEWANNSDKLATWYSYIHDPDADPYYASNPYLD